MLLPLIHDPIWRDLVAFDTSPNLKNTPSHKYICKWGPVQSESLWVSQKHTRSPTMSRHLYGTSQCQEKCPQHGHSSVLSRTISFWPSEQSIFFPDSRRQKQTGSSVRCVPLRVWAPVLGTRVRIIMEGTRLERYVFSRGKGWKKNVMKTCFLDSVNLQDLNCWY